MFAGVEVGVVLVEELVGAGAEGPVVSEGKIVPATPAPWLLIMEAAIDVIPPVPVCEAKDMCAISPLPEKSVGLIMAILMVPGVAVFDAMSAPAISGPCVIVGDASEAESYVMLSWMPAMPSMFAP